MVGNRHGGGRRFPARSMLQISVVKARLLRGAWRRALVVLLGAALGATFGLERLGARSSRAPSVGPAVRPAFTSRAEPPNAERQCLLELAELAKLPESTLPAVDVPELRAQLLGRTKNVPVLFLSQPEVAKGNPLADTLRRALETVSGVQVRVRHRDIRQASTA